MNTSPSISLPQSHSVDVPNFYYTAKLVNHPEISIGEYTYGQPNIRLRGGSKLIIGKFCSIGSNVTINIFDEHPLDFLSTYPFSVLKTDWPNSANIKEPKKMRGDIVIGNDVWIGSEAIILGGVTIGDGAVIGAHAVVAKDVAPYSIVVGNPAREIRKRLSEDSIMKLLEIKWWDWPIEKIRKHAGFLVSVDIDGLYSVRGE